MQFHVRTALYVAARHLIVIAFQSHSRCHGIRIFGCPAVEEGAVPVVRTGETFHLLGIEYLVSEVALEVDREVESFPRSTDAQTADELGSGTAQILAVVGRDVSVTVYIFVYQVAGTYVVLILLSGISGGSGGTLVVVFDLCLVLEDADHVVAIEIFNRLSLFGHLYGFSGADVTAGDAFAAQADDFVFDGRSCQTDTVPEVFQRIFPFHGKVHTTIAHRPYVCFYRGEAYGSRYIHRHQHVFRVPAIVV